MTHNNQMQCVCKCILASDFSEQVWNLVSSKLSCFVVSTYIREHFTCHFECNVFFVELQLHSNECSDWSIMVHHRVSYSERFLIHRLFSGY